MATIVEKPLKKPKPYYIVKRENGKEVTKKRLSDTSYYVVYRKDGKTAWKHAGYRKKDAEDVRREIERAVGEGTYIQLEDITFSELAEKWLATKENKVRPKVLSSYRPHVRRLIERFGDRKVRSITPEEMDMFAAEVSNTEHKAPGKDGKETVKPMSPATAGRCLTIARAIFRTGVKWGYLSRNPAEFIEKPAARKAEIEFLEPEEIKRLIAATEERHRVLIMFACFTGARQSEILGLRWADVDLVAGRVFIRQVLQGNQFFDPKTESSRRTIDLPPALVEELKQHQVRQAVELPKNPHDLVFTNPGGMPLLSRTVTQGILDPALKRAELKRVNFHSLRHSYVSMLISRGVNIKTIQTLVGHASAKMTWDVYGHLYGDETRRAASLIEDIFSEKEGAREEVQIGASI